MIKDFALPDLGEGLTESELVEWHVAVGDTVKLNQIIADVETAKALVELPAPWSGVISRLYVKPGVTINVGERIVAFEVEGDPGDGARLDGPGAATDSSGESAAAVPDVPEPNLVGYGARADSAGRPARRVRPGLATRQEPDAVVAATAPARTSTRASAPAQASAPVQASAQDTAQAPAQASTQAPAQATTQASARATAQTADEGATSTATLERPRATPPVRKLARELGVDLAEVPATGDRGLVTRHDVEQFSAGGRTPAGTEVPETRLVQGARERETRIPIRGVRKHTAEAMVQSAFTAPHATVFLTVDVTETMALLERLKSDRALYGVRMTFLAVVAKAMCIAAMRTPSINSRWDAEANEIVEFGYVNLGIAAATPRGLLVPTIPDADRLTLVDLARALTDLVAIAREGRTPPERLTGGTISVSNVGVFGVDTGTPILNPGEAAILALGAVRRQPWEHDGGIALRDVVTLSVSFDHRLVDGEQGSRFITDVGRILRDPGSVLTMV
ncbi:2-oxo acid dehydrogenase subunit E2 [Diaminobutyricibacter sp. McL0618]|uniref:dihydrolipoamide acetyltransferase family protein n=1 Tax=Leifsonia sp. McL0618 TaxID=3415677 RepID=UPI003CE9B9F4